MVQSTFKQEPIAISKAKAFVLWFEEIDFQDIPWVGRQNASLGEMTRNLTPRGVKIPMGFATTAYAYRYFIEQTGLETELKVLLADLDVENLQDVHSKGEQAHSLILHKSIPQELETAIAEAYFQLSERLKTENQPSHKKHSDEMGVTVCSNLISEALLNANSLGWEETALKVQGLQRVLEACRRCFAALFTNQAIAERSLKGLSHFDLAVSVSIQKTIHSELALSGKLFSSIDPETGFNNVTLITAAQGFRENVAQEICNPDKFFIFKPTLKNGFRAILAKHSGNQVTKNCPISETEHCKYAINDEEIITLAQWACLIEDHFSQPMEMNWAKDRETGELLIVQAHPTQKSGHVLRSYQLRETSNILVRGHAIGNMIGQGKVRVISDIQELSEFNSGEVLVTNRTDPDWRPVMSKARAIITNQGGRTCHSAISAREMEIPCIVGCGTATTDLHTGQEVTVVCAEGEEGRVYQGLLPFEKQETPVDSLPQTRTQILVNVGNPEEAFRLASLPCDGVGVARSEFIITDEVKIHPLALVHFEELKDPDAKQKIDDLTFHYNHHKPDYFVDKLAQGISMIAAAFYPKPVIVRMSDFKSNEYANLLGGQQFEPEEENPMLGWRGASRYYNEKYRKAYHLECQALKRVRDEMGLTNVIPLIPFCRTPDEGRKVLAEMASQGLKRGENDLKVYVMCEIPSNVILAEQFSKIFDGFSIGSNDLTQLVIGIDRDSEDIDHLFDERNEAVKEMIRQVIEKAKKHDRKIGICGQAPSDYPEFVPFLVELGIDSISLNPDSVIKTRLAVSEAEKRLGELSPDPLE
jgi:pyruvate,water dikinase